MKKGKIVGSAIIGNIVEYYDFGLYAVYAPLFGRLFFPAMENPLLQSLLAFSVFAVGFFMRPLGGIFFGYIGDVFGRRTSLSISIIGMAISTLLIGLLPTYQQIGIIAPILLIIIRLFQGLCVGGEGAGVAIFVLEHMEGYRPGLIGSIVMASNMVGTQIAFIVGMIINHFSENPNTWRIAFWIGGAVGMIGFYMRYQLNETPVFEAYKESRKAVKNPIFAALRHNALAVLLVVVVGGATSAVAYTVRGYFNTLFLEVLQFSVTEALYLTSSSLFAMIVLLPCFGILADKIGYKKFFFFVNAIVLLSVYPIFMLLTYTANVGVIFIGCFLFGALAAAICAPAYPYAIRVFEVELRFSGVAFSWNLGNALMGGTTPLIATYLTTQYGNLAPSFYLMSMALLFITINIVYNKAHH